MGDFWWILVRGLGGLSWLSPQKYTRSSCKGSYKTGTGGFYIFLLNVHPCLLGKMISILTSIFFWKWVGSTTNSKNVGLVTVC